MKKGQLYAGIDLHGNNMVIAIVDEVGERITHCKLPCELYAVERFLKPFARRLEKIAVESTFNWYWLVDGLQDLGFEVLLANPGGIEQYAGLKHADDKSDAFFLAELLRLGILPIGYIYDRKLRSTRDLLRRRMLLVSKRTALILSLKNLHARMKGQALSLAHIKTKTKEEIVELFDDRADRVVAEMEKGHIDALAQSIDELEKRAVAAAPRIPHAIKLKTIPGIGDILGTMIALETGDINRFGTPERYASYSRTVPSHKSTNGKKKGENNRKSGNRYLAWAFIEAANFIRRYDETARKWYDRKAAKTGSIIATKAMACKLAKASWHILKNGSDYDAEKLFGSRK